MTVKHYIYKFDAWQQLASIRTAIALREGQSTAQINLFSSVSFLQQIKTISHSAN